MRKAYDALDRRKRTPSRSRSCTLVAVEAQTADAARPRSPPSRSSTRTSAPRPSPATSSACRWTRPPRCSESRRAPSSRGCTAPATGWPPILEPGPDVMSDEHDHERSHAGCASRAGRGAARPGRRRDGQVRPSRGCARRTAASTGARSPWAAVAAALLAVGVGIAHLAPGRASSLVRIGRRRRRAVPRRRGRQARSGASVGGLGPAGVHGPPARGGRRSSPMGRPSQPAISPPPEASSRLNRAQWNAVRGTARGRGGPPSASDGTGHRPAPRRTDPRNAHRRRPRGRRRASLAASGRTPRRAGLPPRASWPAPRRSGGSGTPGTRSGGTPTAFATDSITSFGGTGRLPWARWFR